jgi:hypothetical protein
MARPREQRREFTNSVQSQLDVLSEAIGNSQFAMHHRDYYQVADTIDKFLGRDVLADQRQEEYEALPGADKDKMKAQRSYGQYGLFHLVTRPEVPLALSVVAKKLSPTFQIEARFAKELGDPAVATAVTNRFPSVTADHIQMALGG